jgi:hypothetical protein
VHAGVIPYDVQRHKVKNYNDPLSLHINIGIPGDLKNSTVTRGVQGEIMVDLLTFAYVSPERAETRKTSQTFSITSFGVEPNDMNSSQRFEFRVGAFEDKSTYEMLRNVQHILALLIAEERIVEQVNVDKKDKKLARQWRALKKEIENDVYPLDERLKPSFVDDGWRSDIAALLRERQDVRDKCRELVKRYSRSAKETIYGK